MPFQVRILCGGARHDFILAKDGEECRFETREKAHRAANLSVCVQAMGWHWKIEEVDNAN